MFRMVDELNPDGVRISVEWDKFVPGASVFVPTLNTEEAIKQAKEIAKLRHWKVATRVRIEAGRRGIRMWRVS